MASFDFITSASRAYEFVWYYKGYLARIALPVLFIEIFCILSVLNMGGIEELGVLRANLLTLPACCLEAMYFAMLARFITYHEPMHIWGKPIEPPEIHESDKPITYLKGAVFRRREALQISIACYILVFIFFRLIMWGVLLPASDIMPMSPEMQEQAIDSLLPAPVRIVIALCVFSVIIWCMRLYIISVPSAMGFRPTDYLKKMGSINNSAKMVILIFLCVFPVGAILFPFFSVLINLLSFIPSLRIIFEIVGLYSIFFLIYTLSGTALTFAIQDLMISEEKDDKF